MTETTILDDRAVSEIEARYERAEAKYLAITQGKEWWRETETPTSVIGDSLEDIPALCATVKHLRVKLAMCEGEITAADPGKWGHESKIHLLQSQLEQLRATLAQVEQERDRILQLYNSAWLWVQQRVKHPNSGLPPAAMTLMEMLPLLNQRAIQLCKDKAAEYERQLSGDIGIVTAATLNAQKQTASELAAELEKL